MSRKNYNQGKNKKKQNKGAKSKLKIQNEEQNLDRFAGSSEDDDLPIKNSNIKSSSNSDNIVPSDDDSDFTRDDDDDDGDDDVDVRKDKIPVISAKHKYHLADGEEADASSHGETTDEDDYSTDEDEYGENVTKKGIHSAIDSKRKSNKVKNDENTSSDSDEGSDNEFENEFANQNHTVIQSSGQTGMAGAMAKILGLSAPSSTDKKKPIILSKTITPLQKLQKKEQSEENALIKKQKLRREVNLTALHIPLSVASSTPNFRNKKTDPDSAAKAIAKEVEVERMHRRVATRGVVALFNTITKHQQQRAQQAAEASLPSANSTAKNQQVQSMTKYGFLDMLKQSATADSDKGDDAKEEGKDKISNRKDKKNSSKESNETDGNKKVGWSALQDDFMMNSKLKDWDKEISDEDDSFDDEHDDGVGDADDVMDNDWSSEEDVKPTKKQKKLSAY